MNKRELERLTYMLGALGRIGINYDTAVQLRRISMTLHRWHELECGVGNGGVERDETTGKTYWYNAMTGRRTPTPDRETGALRRLAAIMTKYPHLMFYVQGDPRGAALYIIPKDKLGDKAPDSYYSSCGIAVY